MSAQTLIRTRYKIILPGSIEITEHVRDLSEEPKLPELDAIMRPVLCDWMERVRVLHDYSDGENYTEADMFVAENGHADRLPRNDRATVIYRRATMLGRTSVRRPDDPEQLPFIVGPAIIFDRRVWF